jgi:hypothetical protein
MAFAAFATFAAFARDFIVVGERSPVMDDIRFCGRIVGRVVAGRSA